MNIAMWLNNNGLWYQKVKYKIIMPVISKAVIAICSHNPLVLDFLFHYLYHVFNDNWKKLSIINKKYYCSSLKYISEYFLLLHQNYTFHINILDTSLELSNKLVLEAPIKL